MGQQIIYVVKSAGLCGGVRVILEHVARLCERGHDAKIYYMFDAPEWFRVPVPAYGFPTLDDLGKALRAQHNSIKVATWFETAYWVAENLNESDRGYYLVQDIEESYCLLPQHKQWALGTYKLGLKPIVTSKWVYNQVVERFAIPATLTSLGVNFDAFYPLKGKERDMFRILTQCRVWSAGPNLKGWPTAKSVAEGAFEKDRAVSLVTFGIEQQQPCRPDMPHIHIQRPGDEWLNEIYNTSGLYLLTSNHEGFGLTAAEAMAVGIPVVATLAQGNEEFCFHGKTAMTAEPGDVDTLIKHVLFLFHNPEYADALAKQGQQFIQQYTWDRCVDALEYEFFGPSRGKPVQLEVEEPKFATYGAAGSEIEYPKIVKPLSPEEQSLATIVIPTVNDWQKTEKCLDAIKATTDPALLQVLVVDDGTPDEETVESLTIRTRDFHKVSHRSPDIPLRTYQNLGFSAAVNYGMQFATGKYIILCNNDLQPHKGWLEHMIRVAESDPTIGIVGAKLLYPDGNIQHAGMGKIANALNFPHLNKGESRGAPEASMTRPVWAVTGALFLIKREAAMELGGLSTAYGTAWEDVDYCLHAWTSGWKVYYCAEAEAYHLEGGTRGATYDQKRERPLVWMERERAGESFFMKKWTGYRQFNSLTAFSGRC